MYRSKREILLFIILFGAMFLFGFVENIRGVTYPLIKTEFDISYEKQGLMVSMLSISYVIFCIIGGILLGRFGVKKALLAGFVFLVTGLGTVFFMPGFWPVAGSLLIVFAGFGLFEVSSNALASQLFITCTALFMSLLNFFYGVGAALSPRAAGVLAAALNWRYTYLLSIPLVLLFFIPAVFTHFPAPAGCAGSAAQEKQTAKKVGFLKALMTPMVWAFALTLGFMVVVELSTPNWAGLYFQDVYDADPKTSGAVFLSNFYILFTVSRLLSGFIIERVGYFRSLFIAAVIVVFIFITGFILGPRGIYVLPALGFFAAIFWPTILAAAMRYFKSDAPVMTSAIIVITGILFSVIQYFVGLTNRFIGPAWGYRSSLIYALVVVTAIKFLSGYIKRRPYSTQGAYEKK